MPSIDMPRFVQLVNDNFPPDDIQNIVEVGSLNGVDAVYFKTCFPHADVTAYEGLKEHWEAVTPEGITWLNMVIASYDGEVTYHVKNFNEEMTTGIHGIYDRGKIYGTETRLVPCHRLDSVSSKPIDMMKIDVEGATFDVFEGMGSLLDTVKIMHIETETVPFFSGQKMLHDGVCNYLVGKGFTCLEQRGARIQNGTQFDTVWIKNAS